MFLDPLTTILRKWRKEEFSPDIKERDYDKSDITRCQKI